MSLIKKQGNSEIRASTKKGLITALVVSLFFASFAFAADTSFDTTADTKESRDRSINIKVNRDVKTTDSFRDSSTNSRGRDKTQSSNKQQKGSVDRSGGLDMTIPARALFSADVEKYKLPVDFGLAAEERGGWINTTANDYYAQAAKSGVMVSKFTDETAIRDYLRDVATLGAIAGQAMIYLQQDIAKVGSPRKTAEGEIEITGIGLDDLLLLTDAAIVQAKKSLIDKRILTRLAEILEDKTPCRLAGEPTNIKCGKALLTLAAPPTLRFQGVDWYSPESLAGLKSTYKIASNWSWSKSLEESSQDSKFQKLATETVKAAEKAASEGKGVEAVLAKKKAVERTRASKQQMGAGKLLPGVN